MFLEGGCLKHISDTKDFFIAYVIAHVKGPVNNKLNYWLF